MIRRLARALPALLFAFGAFAAPGGADLMAKANAFYERTRCRQALPIYRQVLSSPKYKKWHDEALFRAAYCYYAVGNYPEAEELFRGFLKRDPSHVESRLRLAESLLFQNDYEQALQEMNMIRLPKADRWIVSYWQGVSNYMLSDPITAQKNFADARSGAPEGSWVRAEASAWLERLRKEQRWVQPNLGVAFVWDGNATYTSAPVATAGYTATLGATFLVSHTRKWKLTVPVSASAFFYAEDKAKPYEFQSLDLGIDSAWTHSPRLSTSLGVHYMDTRLQYRYNQDFVTITPGVQRRLGQETWLLFTPALTWNVVTYHSLSMAPSLELSWRGAEWNMSFGLNYGGSFTDAATVDPTVLKAASGRVSSSYDSAGLQATISRYLPLDLHATLSMGFTRTWFGKIKNLPGGGRRIDNTFGATLTLGWETPMKGLGTSLSAGWQRNLSSGPQLVQDVEGNLYRYDYDYLRPSATLGINYAF